MGRKKTGSPTPLRKKQTAASQTGDIPAGMCASAGKQTQSPLAAVQVEKEVLLALLNSISDEIWFADTQNRFILANTTALKEFGLNSGEVDAEKLAASLEVLRPDGSPRPIEEAPPLRALRGEIVRNQEEIIRTPASHELRHRQVSSTPVRDASGNIIGAVSVVRDITEQKRIEAGMRENEARFRLLFQNMLDGYAICQMLYDDQGRPEDFVYLDVNASVVKLTGLQNVVGKRVSEVIPGIRQSHPELFETYGRVASTGKPERLEIYIEPLRMSFSISVYSPQRDHFVAVFDNITERKRNEDALRESDERLKQAQQIAHVGSWELDLVKNELIWSDEAYRIFGLAPHVFGATYEAFLDVVHPEDRAAVDRAYSGSLREGRDTYEIEHRVIRKASGEIRIVHEKCEHVRDSSGRIIRSIGMVQDITERKRTEDALREAYRRKDEFLAMLAHELRNPLSAITSAIELLKTLDQADATLVRARNAASRQAAHMARLLDDLLDVARVTQGKVMLDKQDVSLHSILESAIEASNPLVNARNHRLYVSHPRKSMHVRGDPVRLSQTISNLLNNAAKYTAPGGEIYLVADREGDEAVIRVRDNGKGIEPELLPHIFELFVQGNRSTDRAEGGLGVGLTLVRSLVELHGGRVEARSTGSGQGSEFCIWLPLLPAVEEHISDEATGDEEKAKPLRILVVDDNVDSAEMVSMLLEIEGHTVTVASSGLAAIEAALKQTPDVALVDIGMPGMDGYEVARRMRALPVLQHTALVAVTGYGQQEDIQKSRDAGFHDHLVKPIDMETLKQVLRKIDENMR